MIKADLARAHGTHRRRHLAGEGLELRVLRHLLRHLLDRRVLRRTNKGDTSCTKWIWTANKHTVVQLTLNANFRKRHSTADLSHKKARRYRAMWRSTGDQTSTAGCTRETMAYARSLVHFRAQGSIRLDPLTNYTRAEHVGCAVCALADKSRKTTCPDIRRLANSYHILPIILQLPTYIATSNEQLPEEKWKRAPTEIDFSEWPQ